MAETQAWCKPGVSLLSRRGEGGLLSRRGEGGLLSRRGEGGLLSLRGEGEPERLGSHPRVWAAVCLSAQGRAGARGAGLLSERVASA